MTISSKGVPGLILLNLRVLELGTLGHIVVTAGTRLNLGMSETLAWRPQDFVFNRLLHEL